MIHHPIYPATMFAFQVWLGTMQMKRVPTLVLRSPWRDSVSPRVTWWLHASSRWKWMKVNMLKSLETNNINAWENRDSFGSWENRIWFNIIYVIRLSKVHQHWGLPSLKRAREGCKSLNTAICWVRLELCAQQKCTGYPCFIIFRYFQVGAEMRKICK